MSNSCLVVKKDLVECIHTSPCWNEQKREFGDCLKEEDTKFVSEGCQQLKQAYFLCKRGQVHLLLIIETLINLC